MQKLRSWKQSWSHVQWDYFIILVREVLRKFRGNLGEGIPKTSINMVLWWNSRNAKCSRKSWTSGSSSLRYLNNSWFTESASISANIRKQAVPKELSWSSLRRYHETSNQIVRGGQKIFHLTEMSDSLWPLERSFERSTWSYLLVNCQFIVYTDLSNVGIGPRHTERVALYCKLNRTFLPIL